MQEIPTTEEEPSSETAEERGESVHHLNSILSNYVFQIT